MLLELIVHVLDHEKKILSLAARGLLQLQLQA